jgi:putative hydrolase of the HAD superfamily
MRYKALFIDLDNTLYDFAANSLEAYHEVYELMDYERYFSSFEAYFAIYETRNAELWNLYENGKITKDELNTERYLHPLKVAHVNDAEAIARTFFAEAMKRLPTKGLLRPYAIECLEYLHPRYPLYILSNGFTELQTPKMQSAGIDHYFDGIVLSEDIQVNKPQRALFDHALTISGTTAEESLMIGDHFEVDIVGAKNAGWDQMFYNARGFTEKPFEPTYEITSLDQVKEYL